MSSRSPRKRSRLTGKTHPLISKSEARAYLRRWAAVNALEREELRRTPLETKLKQLGTLMAWAREFGWDRHLAAEDEQVRERWNRLRRAWNA